MAEEEQPRNSVLVPERKSSFVDNLTKGLAIATRWTKQTLGSVAPSLESTDFIELEKRYLEAEKDLKSLSKALQTHAQDTSVQHRSFEQTMDSLAPFASHVDGHRPCGSTVQCMVRSQNVLQSKRAQLLESFRTLLLAPINHLVSTELKEAAALRTAYTQAHLVFDAATDVARGDMSDDARIQAVVELKRATIKYKEAREAFMSKCREIDNKKNAILSVNLGAYMDQQVAFYGDAYRAFEPDHERSVDMDSEGASELALSVPPEIGHTGTGPTIR